MKERPILFSGPMVQAILDGRKNQTRRVVKPPAPFDIGDDITVEWATGSIPCPYGAVGDQLWVRETWRTEELEGGLDGVRFRADNVFREIENTKEAAAAWMDANKTKAWRPSIFMPRWASRITLEIVDVRVERVQDISEVDAMREGVARFEGPIKGVFLFQDYSKAGWDVPVHTARESFRTLICSINGEEIWTRNEWVWVVGFKVVQPC